MTTPSRSLPADDGLLHVVAARATEVELAAGDVLFREGDEVDAAYVVSEGRLRLSRGAAPDDVWVGDSTRGSLLGEVGVLAGSTRTATAVATRRTRAFRIAPEAFEKLMLDDPSFALFVARRAAAVAVSATRGDVPAPPVTLLAGNGVQSRLLEALHAAARERIVALDESQGLDADTDIGIGDGVARPVFVAASPGSRALVDTVDRVVVVHEAGTPVDASLAAVVRARAGRGLGAQLVVVHDTRQPCGAGAIADEWGVDDLVNVELGDRRDVRRLLRVLTDQPRALVLGAGGARAFAQIGAIRAFEEAGEEFDVVLGSGFGAVIGAQYALGWTADELLARNRAAWSVRGRMPTLPSLSAFSGASVAALLRRWFGTRDIADTRMQFRPCVTDLSDNLSRTMMRGSLADWVRAASATPGLYPPHVLDGHLYVDGSVVDPLPAGHARELGAATVYAVDTRPLRRHTTESSQVRPPEGLSWFVQSIPVIGGGFPSVFALVEHALSASQARHQAELRERCDLVIEPPVDRYGVLDYGAADALAEIGYLEAVRRLEEHRNG